jgi:hypothetical protein
MLNEYKRINMTGAVRERVAGWYMAATAVKFPAEPRLRHPRLSPQACIRAP